MKQRPIGRIVKRVMDIVLAVIAIGLLSPIMLIAVIGIKCSSRGPVIYKATRMGIHMQPMTIYKFRTMCINADKESSITAAHDKRIFPFGQFLRNTKIDELPQLFNILQGDMSIVGPRPEDVAIVKQYYTKEQKKTLQVHPGLASPGSIFNYTHGDLYLTGPDVETSYVEKFMPVKLGMDLYYVQHWSLLYDAEVIWRTVTVIIQMVLGRKEFPYPKEYKKVTEHLMLK